MCVEKTQYVSISEFNEWFEKSTHKENEREQLLFNQYFDLLQRSVNSYNYDEIGIEVPKGIINEMMTHFGKRIFTMKENFFIGNPILNMMCICLDKVDLINWFIEIGGDPNVWNDHTDTPLHLAISYENKDIIKTLLANGSVPYWGNKKGYTAIDQLRLWEKDDVVDVMSSYTNGPTIFM